MSRQDSAPLPTRAWDSAALRDVHQQRDKAARVEAMFDAIAPTYERVNSLATFGRDAAWRRKAVAAAAVQSTDIVLDVACGTGDMLRTFAAHHPKPARLIGLDFSANMLAAGRYDGLGRPHLLRGDAQRLPLADSSVDIVSCAFGVRNFQTLQQGLDEMARVLRPGGRVVILEFANPQNAILRRLYRVYCETVLPALGTWLSQDRSGAYRYLPKSIESFETRASMCRRLEDAGFAGVTDTAMNLGGVVLYRGVRAG